MSDELYELMKKNLREGLLAARQGPDALRRQADSMFPPEGPAACATSATPRERRAAFARALKDLFPPKPPADDEECSPQTETSYQLLLAAAPHGAAAVRHAIQEIQPGAADWIRAAWNVLEARRKGRPHFLFKDPETGSFIHWPPGEGVLRKLLNREAQPSPGVLEE